MADGLGLSLVFALFGGLIGGMVTGLTGGYTDTVNLSKSLGSTVTGETFTLCRCATTP
jgi:hypothetical protein